MCPIYLYLNRIPRIQYYIIAYKEINNNMNKYYTCWDMPILL